MRADRRAKRVLYQRYSAPPSHWTGSPPEIDDADPPVDAQIVEGIGVSPGVKVGTARVLTSPDFDDVEPGEILVATFTDPGWAWVMFISAALVVDIGGPLSHAAVVARELACRALSTRRTARSSSEPATSSGLTVTRAP